MWQTIVPRLAWDSGRLTGITIQPVTLGMDRPVHDRGTPVVPTAADAERILADVTRLSKAYGCDVRAEGASAPFASGSAAHGRTTDRETNR